MLVSSVPLSLTIDNGLPRRVMTASSSRPTRAPDKDVSATSVRHSRVKSSTTARMRNRRLSISVSLTKSSDQRWFGPCGNTRGALVPNALLRPPRRRTWSRSSRYNRLSFLWFTHVPSRRSRINSRPIAKTASDRGKLAQPGAQHGIVRAHAGVSHRRSISLNYLARPALAHLIGLAEVRHSLPLYDGRHHFFALRSFNMALSSIASASSFFSLRFSSSSTFSRRASETSRPPYFDFHL